MPSNCEKVASNSTLTAVILHEICWTREKSLSTVRPWKEDASRSRIRSESPSTHPHSLTREKSASIFYPVLYPVHPGTGVRTNTGAHGRGQASQPVRAGNESIDRAARSYCSASSRPHAGKSSPASPKRAERFNNHRPGDIDANNSPCQ